MYSNVKKEEEEEDVALTPCFLPQNPLQPRRLHVDLQDVHLQDTLITPHVKPHNK